MISYRALTQGYIGGYAPRKLRAVVKAALQSFSPCINQRNVDCNGCPHRQDCCYFNLIVEVRNFDFLPYFITLEDATKWRGCITPGSIHSFEITIIGNKISFADQVESALHQKRYIPINGVDRQQVCFELDALERTNKGEPLRFHDLMDYHSMRHMAQFTEINSVAIDFLTPLCLTYGNKTITDKQDMDFTLFHRKLFHRVERLAKCHCEFRGSIPEIYNDRGLKEGIETILHRDFRFISHTIKRCSDTEKIGGFKGKLSFEGDLTSLFPLIVLGEALHIGNDTTQGHGKYSIVEVNDKKISLSTR